MLKKTVRQLMGSRMFSKFLLKQHQHISSYIYYVYVDPKEISHISLIPEDSYRLSGPEAAYGIFSGFFDLVKMPFKEHSMYRTVGQLMQGGDWKLTPHFRKLIEERGESWAIQQHKKLEGLVEKLSNEGYLSQFELGNVDKTKKIYERDVPLNEMVIGIDRNGKLFRIEGGKHRLAIAQHIEIPVMPAILTLYHQNAVDMLPNKRRKIIGAPTDFMPF